MRIFVTGATGFIGTHLRRALVRAGHDVVGLARTAQPEEQGVTWAVGGLEQVDHLTEAMADCHAVIHLVGILRETKQQTYATAHVQATEHVLAAMRRANINRLLHMSALGAGPKQPTEYFRSKWAAEELVRAAGIDYTIFRPSIVFGPGDGFIPILVQQIRLFPILPIVGSGRYPMAPISITALCEAFTQALELNGSATAKTFELCGPETLTYEGIIDLLATHLRRRKPRIHLPVALMHLLIRFAHFMHLPPPLTEDELNMLLLGSTCTDPAAIEVFDLPHITLAEGIREYVKR